LLSMNHHSGRPALHVLHVESGHEWRLTRNQVSLLVEGLLPYTHVRQAVATLERSRLAVAARELGVPVIPLPWAVGTDPRALRMLAHHARHRWDVVHAHDTHALRLLSYLAALEGSRSGLVASRRTVAPLRSAWKWRRANLVLAVSETARRSLVAAGVERARIVVVPEGLDVAGLTPQRSGILREAAGAATSHFLVGSLAALGRDRDHSTLIRAAAIVTARHPHARFAIFGDGPERGRLEHQIERLGLGGRVCLPGFVPGARSSLVDLDLVVMPSLREEMSTGVLESLHAGVPVVMTAEGDGRLRGGGIEPVRKGDHEALAETIGRFIEDAAVLREAGERARNQARLHDAGCMVRTTLEAYDAVARLCRTTG
jgi:glycosyltransferase involved in cell wall biosynthesis